MTYSIIGILASILLLIINHDIMLNHGRDTLTKTQRSYRLFLMGVLVYLITDLLWGILDSHHLIGLLFADSFCRHDRGGHALDTVRCIVS